MLIIKVKIIKYSLIFSISSFSSFISICHWKSTLFFISYVYYFSYVIFESKHVTLYRNATDYSLAGNKTQFEREQCISKTRLLSDVGSEQNTNVYFISFGVINLGWYHGLYPRLLLLFYLRIVSPSSFVLRLIRANKDKIGTPSSKEKNSTNYLSFERDRRRKNVFLRVGLKD